jgi:hypothetical protein
MDPGLTLTKRPPRNRQPLESLAPYLSSGKIENRSFGSDTKNDILLPAVKNSRESAEREAHQPKKWKFDETP